MKSLANVAATLILLLVVAFLGHLHGKHVADTYYASHPKPLPDHIVRGMAILGDCRFIPPNEHKTTSIYMQNNQFDVTDKHPCVITSFTEDTETKGY